MDNILSLVITTLTVCLVQTMFNSVKERIQKKRKGGKKR